MGMGYPEEILERLEREGIKPGDRVRVVKDGVEYVGILMPRIELGDRESLIIKQDNGYNVGVKVTKDTVIERVGEGRKLEVFPARKVEENPELPSITIFSTGGTIAARVSYLTGGVIWSMTPEEIFFTVPELQEIVNLKETKILFRVFSENMIPKYWRIMAEEAARALKSSDGLIIMHGTDTLHYTGAALSFMLKNLTKPVVLVGAQRSTDRGSADGPMNLICSAHVACSDIAEVCIVMHANMSDDYCLINRGCRTRKMHTSRRDAFRPINSHPIGKVWMDGRIEIIDESYRRRGEGEVEADTRFEERVALIKAYPGARPDIIDYYVDKGYRGIVIEATGLGHVPMGEIDWYPSIKRAIEEGVAVVFAPQTLYGRLHPLVYEPGRKLYQLGVIYAGDMLPEVAYVKLGFVLGHTRDMEEVREMMLRNIAGEIGERLEYDTYLY
mgnify:CR=1 FL=1